MKKLNLSNSFISFEESYLDEINFERTHLHNRVSLEKSKISYLNLNETYIYDNFLLKDSNILHLNVLGASVYGSLNCDWKLDRIKNKILFTSSPLKGFFKLVPLPKKCLEYSEQFRILKQNFNKLGKYEDEDMAYVQYKKYRAFFDLQENNKTKGIVSLVFCSFGKYGTHPLSIFIWITGLIILFAYFSKNNIDYTSLTEEKGYFQCYFQKDPTMFKMFIALYFSAITFFTIGYGDISPSNFTGSMLSVGEGFIGVASMAYLTVAIIRKVLR